MTNESIANEQRAIAKALGADYSLRVGKISIAEIANGTALRIAAQARALHEGRSEIDEPQNAIERTIIRLHDALGPESTVELNDHQARHVLFAGNSLLGLRKGNQEGTPQEVIIRELFGLYFEHQSVLTETTAGHWLRIVGDEFAIDTGFDLDRAWELYQGALNAHERRN